ncbi:MAG TPA: prepilin-type N-terminal cleavage/methylation domain-containing protein [Longimicrobiales bacterium]|jgi:prepilin-type N-terminal cleavage/methylation domain-containing protein
MRDRTGFTLIEMLIVVVVIGILAAIAIPRFTASRNKAYRSAVVSDLRNLSNHEELYHGRYLTYSTSLADIGAVSTEGVNTAISVATSDGWGATATHDGIPNGQCGIFVGDAPASSGDPATTAGVVTCNY